MNKLLNIILITSFSMAGCFTSGQVSQSDNYNYSDNYDNTEVSYQTFYDQLSPYGNWISSPEYGNVWQPNMSEGFRPYETSGHWVSTVDGWAWASDYDWGWAPFHYGRWMHDQSIGWAWVPGYEWAPAWVTWGQYNNYYAWAPLAPGINISLGNTWRAPSDYWSFVPRNYINYSNLNRYTVRSNYNTNVNNITIINNYNSYNQKDYYHRGPDYQEVERYTHKTITPVGIASAQEPGRSRVVRKEFEVYRPSVTPNSASQSRTNALNQTRRYNGSIRPDIQTKGNINQPNSIRNGEDINLKNSIGDKPGAISNGANNAGNVTQESIDNTNRQMQQQQMERLRNMRRQTPLDNTAGTPERPARLQQYSGNDQQNAIRQPTINNSRLDNIQPVRPQNQIQNERNIQRPAFPQQSERIMRAPQSSSMPAAPNRMERRDPPVRSMQIERPASRLPLRP